MFSPSIYYSGIHHLFSLRYSGLGHILTFHRVVPNTGAYRIHNHKSLEISPFQLEKTIKYFKENNYLFLKIDQLQDYLLSQEKRKFVIFTFDDGYIDNYTYAFPLMVKYKVPFTIYIASGFPDRQIVLWWYYLEDFILNRERISFEWNNHHYFYHCRNNYEKEKSFYALRNLFIETWHTEIPDLIKNVSDSKSFNPFEKTEELMLDWQQIKKLAGNELITIGGHTVNHLALSKQTQKMAVYEITHSKERIESQTGCFVEHFSFPFGSRNEVSSRDFELISRAGYRTGVTTQFSNIFVQHTGKLLSLPRITINSLVNNKILDLCTSGMIPAIRNKFRRIIAYG